MRRPARARLQRLDRTTDAAPYGLPIGIAQLKHAVDHPCRLDQCIRAMSTDNQIGRAVDVQVRDHDASLAGRLGRILDHLISGGPLHAQHCDPASGAAVLGLT
jgi:hypothetical protein